MYPCAAALVAILVGCAPSAESACVLEPGHCCPIGEPLLIERVDAAGYSDVDCVGGVCLVAWSARSSTAPSYAVIAPYPLAVVSSGEIDASLDWNQPGEQREPGRVMVRALDGGWIAGVHGGYNAPPCAPYDLPAGTFGLFWFEPDGSERDRLIHTCDAACPVSDFVLGTSRAGLHVATRFGPALCAPEVFASLTDPTGFSDTIAIYGPQQQQAVRGGSTFRFFVSEHDVDGFVLGHSLKEDDGAGLRTLGSVRDFPAAAATDGGGNTLAVFNTFAVFGATERTLRVERAYPSGASVWEREAGARWAPAIAPAAEGGLLVWSEPVRDAEALFALRLDAEGAPLDAREPQPLFPLAAGVGGMSAAEFADDEFLAVWFWQRSIDSGVYAGRIACVPR